MVLFNVILQMKSLSFCSLYFILVIYVPVVESFVSTLRPAVFCRWVEGKIAKSKSICQVIKKPLQYTNLFIHMQECYKLWFGRGQVVRLILFFWLFLMGCQRTGTFSECKNFVSSLSISNLKNTYYNNYIALASFKGASVLQISKSRFRNIGRPKRSTRWVNFLVGFWGPRPIRTRVRQRPFLGPKITNNAQK